MITRKDIDTFAKRPLVRKALYALPILILIISTLYFSWYSNLFFANVQDAIIYPYLMQDPHLHDLLLPAKHTNLLKFPFFLAQSLLPYNFFTLTLANFTLVIVGVGGWCLLTLRVFGKKYLPLIAMATSAFLLGSILMHYNLAENTIRNIEYPLGLAYILAIAAYLKNPVLDKRRLIVGGILGGLLAVALAGDAFMLYAFITPILALLAVYSLQSQSLKKKVIIAFLFVFATTLLGMLIRKALPVLGIADLRFSPAFENNILPYDQLWPSFSHAISQLLDLSGANIFGRPISIKTSLYFVNFIAVLAGLVGLFTTLAQVIRSYTKKKAIEHDNSFLFGVIGFSFIITAAAYILSGMVLSMNASGALVDSSQSRYITLLSFLLIIGLVLFFKRFYSSNVAMLFSVLLGISIAFSAMTIHSEYSSANDGSTRSRQVISNVIKAAKDNDVKLIISGDTLGATTRFWSNDTIKYASVIYCNQRFTHNIKRSWYTPSNDPLTVALVVDRTGLDGQYWSGCTRDKIETMYGRPDKKVEVPNPQGTEPIDMWIYHHDVRSKIIAN